MTLKQLQAFLWVTRLGSFAAAAKKLHTTQSTVSTRVIELEASLGVQLFDRSGGAARLTAKGRELLPLAERVLGLEAQIKSTVGDPKSLSGAVKVGVAEFVALSWLPRWVARANRDFPSIVLEIDVDLTLSLQEKLAAGKIDLALLPGPTPDPNLVQKDLGAVTFAWMASPSLGVPTRITSAKGLEPFPIILLSQQSNLHAVLRNWFELASASPRRLDTCNSLTTVASLTMAGLGVSFLPVGYHRNDIRAGRLKLIRTQPSIDPLNYVAAYRSDRPNSMVRPLSDLAVALSDFERRPARVRS
ncbi:MAG: LysR family transcriptional regulator [Comamonadaceae bacterium]|nr:LysR family transcriptional regulator [Comamonadaceae bacterium]